MSEPIIVWIVEDAIEDAAEAWEVVQKVLGTAGLPAKVFWAGNFDWYPNLKSEISQNSPGKQQSARPDVVILDLCYRAQNSEELRGNLFYQQLRKWETHEPSGLPALVVLWSLHQGRQDTDKFVRHVISSDSRVIPLASKRKELLRSTFTNCLHRVIDERDL